MAYVRVLNFSYSQIYSFQFTSSIYIFMYKRLLVIAACIFLALAACDMNDQISDIEVGILNFQAQSTNSPINTQNFEYTFLETFSSTPRIALAVGGFNLRSMNFESWDISPSQITTNLARIQFQQSPTMWMSTKVLLLASARQDLIVGNQIARFNAIKNSSATSIINLNTIITVTKTLAAQVYLTGYGRVSGNVMDISSQISGVNSNSIRLVIQTGSGFEVDSARVNFIIFDTSKIGFQAYGGQTVKNNFLGSTIVNLNKQIYKSNYKFYGISNIKAAQQSFSVNSDVTDSLFAVIESTNSIQQLTYNFIIMGVSNQALCSQCTQKMFYKNQCVNSCPADSYQAPYIQNNQMYQGCRTCPSNLNLVINPTRNGCTCAPGYIIENGYCVSAQATVQIPVVTTNSGNANLLQNQNILPNRDNAQSYSPNVGNNNPVIQAKPSTAQPPTSQQQNTNIARNDQPLDCTKLPNSYLVGNRCVCRVGFTFENGICIKKSLVSDPNIFKPAQFIYKISYIYTHQKPVPCTKQNEYYDGENCRCVQPYKRSNDGSCILDNIPDIICPPNSSYENGACICHVGYKKQGQVCILVNKCPINAYHNGVQCVCQNGYYMQNGKCVKGQPCPAYSQRKNGQCVCIAGYSMNNGKCSRCPQGQAYIPSENKCIITCGINQIVNSSTKKCECRQGYGKYEGICNFCPKNFFALNGYCVMCPIGSEYDQKNMKCICGPGLMMHNSGYCQQKCTNHNQIYHAASDSCRCIEGLARINGICQKCINGVVNPSTQTCSNSCGSNQILKNGKCICQPGYGINNRGKCIECSSIAGSFYLDGFCATCPHGQVRINDECTCNQGQKLIGNKCQNHCLPGQLQDHQGNCYYCPLNQIPINGKCQCYEGYTLNGFICEKKCKQNQILINGRCGMCALNTKFDANLGACVCPPGSYKNAKGVCVKSVLQPVECPQGKFFDQIQGCISCPNGCSQCKDSNTCTKCSQNGRIPQGNQCIPQCGDGLILPGQRCDDKNSRSGDGCSRLCQVEDNYVCNGIPSICSPKGTVCGDGKISQNQECDDNNTKSQDGCNSLCKVQKGYKCQGKPSSCKKQEGQPNSGMELSQQVLINYSNVFALIKTDKAFTFKDDNQKLKFMKADFPNPQTEPNSFSCLPVQSDPKLFRCITIYSSGVPNYPFKINFSYNHQGSQGFLAVNVDPTASFMQSRSLV